MKKLLLLLVLVALVNSGRAQDAAFSQYYASGIYLNPALSSAEKHLTFNSNYRTQWRSATIPYVTSQVSLIVPLITKVPKKRHLGGVGISAFNDRAGDGNFKTTGVNLTASKLYKLTADGLQNVALGVQAGFVQKSLDFSNLEWGEQFNPFVGFDPTVAPTEATIKPNVLYPDVTVGAMYYFNPEKSYLFTGMSGYSGLVLSHITFPNESLVEGQVARLPLLIKYHGGIEIHVSNRINVSPNILYLSQFRHTQTNAGFYLSYLLTDAPIGTFSKTEVIFGTWYRLDDSFIFSFGIDNDSYTLGFSYDMNTSTIRYATQGRGAYEISLALRKASDKKQKRFSTPRI
jgi:type IX secretion system PorP/SprF family membrane protein